MDHADAQKSYGTDRARLVYGKRSDGSLAHISEVARGLACGCVCPACDASLVARLKDDHQVPHFAHHGGEACGGGPETVLHLLAKEVFRSNPKMLLPERVALDHKKRVVMKPPTEVKAEFHHMEYTDPKGIIPDLYVRALGYDLFVEVAVTHFSDSAKIQRLRQHQIPAVEIDLSKLPRDALRETVTEAVLHSARRRWLYHPGIDAAQAQYEIDEAARQERQDRRWAEAAERHKRRVEGIATEYRKAANKQENLAARIPRQEELKAVGLAAHVGIKVPGFACFGQPPAAWQAIILAEVFYDKRIGQGPRKAVPVANYLDKRGLVERTFQRLSNEVAADVAALEPGFAPAWKAVDAYLDYLLGKGVLVNWGYGAELNSPFAERWEARTLAETQRTAVMQAAVRDVEWILGELPEGERAGMTGEAWLQSIHRESGLTYKDALRSDIEAAMIVGQVSAIAAMLKGHGPLPRATLGLPIVPALARRQTQMAKQAEALREKQLQEAMRNRHARRDRLCIDAEKEMSGAELEAFLHTKRDRIDGMTLIELAEDSEAGLNRAREALKACVWQRQVDAAIAAEKAKYQARITELAERGLSEANAAAFLKARDDELGRMSPLQYVKDEQTFQKACASLAQWQRQFGR
ncbi:hypothetical protein [Mesorhizobium sp. B2-8-5]|uniref:hypothetical protein n=1 Tax=Mesorhizobium sp. B2-8-5 TaxID=2589903 RepID=UPI00112B6E78|nr:hypothetical protein [Mesorhizobium sp. B2-8-5]UCI23990.1 hypothetical protein FJ430_20545 [Mesorhizobium sp. B2-8-5]